MDILMINMVDSIGGVLFFALLMLVILIIDRRYFKRKQEEKLLLLDRLMSVEQPGAKELDLLEYTRNVYKNTYSVVPSEYLIPAMSNAEEFLRQIHGQVESVESVGSSTRVNNYLEDTATHLALKLTQGKRHIFAVLRIEYKLSSCVMNTAGANPKGVREIHGVEFSDLEEGETVVPVIKAVAVLGPNNKEHAVKKKRLHSLLAGTRLKFTEKSPTLKSHFRIYKFESQFGSVGLSPKNVSRGSGGYDLDLLYEDTTFEFEGEEYQMPMTKTMHILIAILKNKGNVLLRGDHGTGKSQFMLEMMYTLSRYHEETDQKFRVIFVTPTDMHNLEAVLDRESFEGRTIIMVDEADPIISGEKTKDMGTLSQLLAGSMKEAYRVSFLLATNLKIEEINETIRTPHRLHQIVEFSALPPKKAKVLSTVLKDTSTGESVFDMEAFKKLKPEEMKLSNIFACQKSKAVEDILKGALREFFSSPSSSNPSLPESVEEDQSSDEDEEYLNRLGDKKNQGPIPEQVSEDNADDDNNSLLDELGIGII